MMGRRYNQPKFDNSVLIHEQTKEEDTKAVLKHIKPYMQLADYAVVNLETQVADHKPAEKAPKSVTFISPPETLNALTWAGIDYVTLGNNHTFDYLDSGLKSTLEHLKQSGLGYSGAGHNEETALAPYSAKLNNNDYAMLGYVGWEGSARPSQTASPNKGGAAHGSMENITHSVSQAVKHKQLPIVQYHGSLEYTDEPTGVTEQRLKSAIDQGAVMAVAHHPHVAQGFEIYNGKLIAYSMGNFVFDQYFYSTPHSFVLYVWMDGEDFHRAEIIPVYLQGYKPTPAIGNNRDITMKRLKTLSALRGTDMLASGGHGVIPNITDKINAKSNRHSLEVNNNSLAPLFTLPWQASVKQIQVPQNTSYRLGSGLTNNGDFENFASFDSPERGWWSSSEYEIAGDKNNKYLSVKSGDESHWFGMQNFRRVFKTQ